MSALGQKQALEHASRMSALPPRADIYCIDLPSPLSNSFDARPGLRACARHPAAIFIDAISDRPMPYQPV